MSERVLAYLILLFLISIFAIYKYKRLTAPFKILTILIVLTFLSEVVSRYLAITIRNSNYTYHFFSVIEYSCIAIIYLQSITSSTTKSIIKLTLLLVPVLAVLNTIFVQPLYTFPSNIILVTYTLLLLFSLSLFYQFWNYPLQVRINEIDVFILNCLILMFCVSVFCTLGVYNYFLRHHLNNYIITTINYSINITFYLGIGVCFYRNSKRKRWKR